MSLSDSANLLARIPELKALAGIPRIARAVESGDPHAVYRALWWTRTLRQAGEHDVRIEALLEQRRRFLVPMGDAPPPGIGKGFFRMLYGEDDLDRSDGSYGATWFVTLFFVPVFPLARYLIRPAPRGSELLFLGKLPLGTTLALWRHAVPVGLCLAAVGLALHLWDAAGHRDVLVINGLDLPVHATLGPKVLDLAPESRQTAHLPLGVHPYTATTAEGGVVDSGTYEVGGSADGILIWNVAGLAPLYHEQVIYTVQWSKEEVPSSAEILCGLSQLSLIPMDDVFATPPAKLSMSKDGAPITRDHLDVDSGGWRSCLFALASVGAMDLASDVGYNVIHAHGRSPGVTDDVLGLLDAGARAGAPVEEERTETASLPPPPPVDRALNALHALVPAATEHPVAPGNLCRRELALRRYESALSACRDFAHAAPPQAIDPLKARVTALVALRRSEEALALVQKAMAEGGEPVVQAARAALYARVVRQQAGPDPEALLATLEGEAASLRPLGRVWGGGDPSAAEVAALAKGSDIATIALSQVALRDPAAALESAETAPSEVLAGLDPALRALLFGEAVRTGDTVASNALSRADPSESGQWTLGLLYLRGEDPGPTYLLVPTDVRAAFALIRSRGPDLSAAERERLIAAARADDLLAGPVTWASERWPR